MNAPIPKAPMELVGQVADASNLVFVVELDGQRAVYKPIRGERPLWDFPDGTLAAREVAVYLISEALGFSVVPVTELRDGLVGPGAVQRWVDGEVSSLVNLFAEHELPVGWLPVLRGANETGDSVVVAHADDERLARIALLDLVANNADRKAGHLLDDGTVWAIDNGLSFHDEPKLRTVLWGWAGKPLPAWAMLALKGLAVELEAAVNGEGILAEHLARLLSPVEIQACHARVRALVESTLWPLPQADRPMIPWPLF